MIVTFLYRVKGDATRYYGKYIGKCPSTYEEGMDRALAEIMFPFFQHTYPDSITDLYDLLIGVISVERDGQDYFSEHEKDIFDLLYCNWSNQPVEIHLNGKHSKWTPVV